MDLHISLRLFVQGDRDISAVKLIVGLIQLGAYSIAPTYATGEVCSVKNAILFFTAKAHSNPVLSYGNLRIERGLFLNSEEFF